MSLQWQAVTALWLARLHLVSYQFTVIHGIIIHTMMVLIVVYTWYVPAHVQQYHTAGIHLIKYHSLPSLWREALIPPYSYFSSTFRFFSTLVSYQSSLYKSNKPPTSRSPMYQPEQMPFGHLTDAICLNIGKYEFYVWSLKWRRTVHLWNWP